MSRILSLQYHPCNYTRQHYISQEMFDEALIVYENNQSYYIDHNMFEELIGLESWFILVIEPPPKYDPKLSVTDNQCNFNSWLEREKDKISGRNHYCDLSMRNKVMATTYFHQCAKFDLNKTISHCQRNFY